MSAPRPAVDGRSQADITARLCARHPRFAETTVARWVAEVADSFACATVTAFAPLLVERFIADRLRDLETLTPSAGTGHGLTLPVGRSLPGGASAAPA